MIEKPGLRRVLGFPLLTLYGVGVTVGAGIFVLIGTIVGIAGVHAPLAFLLASLLAGVSALSYKALSGRYPRSAGEAVYVQAGFGPRAGFIVGLGVAITGTLSSAAITIGFTGYLSQFTDLPGWFAGLLLLGGFGVIITWGIKESVILAAIITVLEIGTLAVIIGFGWQRFGAGPSISQVFILPADITIWNAVISASVVAFFAFIGFEDIVNVADETVDASRTLGQAIIATLLITTGLYVLLAMLAVSAPDPDALANAKAPLTVLFEQLSGRSGAWLSAIALVAVSNGILVQIIMVSRVLYGMSREELLPPIFGRLGKQQTPVFAIWLVTITIMVLCVSLPIVQLAKATTYVTLAVFTLVNLSLWRLASASTGPFRRQRYIGLTGAVLTAALLIYQALRAIS